MKSQEIQISIEITTNKFKHQPVVLLSQSRKTISFSRQIILPRIWMYQRNELENLKGNFNTSELRISSSTLRWIIRDLLKNTWFMFTSIFLTRKLEASVLASDLPITISGLNENGKIWVSRDSVSNGICASNLDESLEYDKLRFPRNFDFLVRRAILKSEDYKFEVYEEGYFTFAVETREEQNISKFEVNHAIVENCHISHGRIVKKEAEVLQISNIRNQIIRRKPSYLEQDQNGLLVLKSYFTKKSIPKAIYIGSDLNWFHFLVECGTRFVAIPEQDRSGNPIILESGVHRNIVRLCELMTGIEPILLRPQEEILVDKLIIGREAGVLDPIDCKVRSKELRELREIILNSKFRCESELPSPHRIFLRRRKGLFRPLQNESRIAKLLFNNGFIGVYPENLDLDQFITLMERAEIVVSESGAALTNMIFANKDLRVIELSPGDQEFGFWEDFGDIFGLRYAGVKGVPRYVGPKGVARDGFLINRLSLTSILREWITE